MIRHDLLDDRGRWRERGRPSAQRNSPALVALMALTALLFLASASAFVGPGLSQLMRIRNGAVPAPAPSAATPLSDGERALVLSYAQTMRPDDSLVEIRPGVQAKRSNVEGVRVGNRSVYYDVAGHQSFGPVAAGRVRESDAVILSREGTPPFVVVLYALKS